MADQSPRREDRAATFTIASSAIPTGVRCGACGRLHLPHRLHALAAHDSDQVVLGCARCGATGPLAIDAEDPVHAEVVRAIRRVHSPGSDQ